MGRARQYEGESESKRDRWNAMLGNADPTVRREGRGWGLSRLIQRGCRVPWVMVTERGGIVLMAMQGERALAC